LISNTFDTLRSEANTRLIAATPDLLKALENLFCECVHIGNYNTSMIVAMNEAEAAIAKTKINNL
jgi:hypothetical protein